MSAPFSTPRRELASKSFRQLTECWNNPSYAAQVEAEGKRLNDASMTAMDAGIARYRAAWNTRPDNAGVLNELVEPARDFKTVHHIKDDEECEE